MKYLTPLEKLRFQQHTRHRYLKNLRRCKKTKDKKIQNNKDGIIKRGNSQYKKISLPSDLDFSIHKDITLSFFKSFRDYSLVVREEMVCLDFSGLKGISPAASIVLIAEIYRCWKFNNRKIVAVGIRSCQLSEHFELMGFYDLLEVPKKLRKKSDKNAQQKIYVKFATATEDVGELADKIRNAVYDPVQDSLSADVKEKLYSGLLECMSNVSRHAYDEQFKKYIDYPFNDRRWWLSGYVDRVEKEVMIQFYDQGAGIPNTLPSTVIEKVKKYLESIISTYIDANLIKTATEPEQSTTKEKYRGKGLPQILDVIKNSENGELRIISNKGDYTIKCSNTRKLEENLNENKISLAGTLIQWKIRNA